MLDDLKYIHQKDGQDALGIAEKQWQQVAHDFTIEPEVSKTDISNIVFAGMGGSALAAELLKSWLGLPIPLEIVKGYDIPAYVDETTLFIASSYSGNTEETLSALQQAEAKNAQIAVISAGGKLQEADKNSEYPMIALPQDFQPRMATIYSFKALLTLLDALEITDNKAAELAATSTFLEEAVKSWRPDVATKQNQAKQIALEVIGKSAVVYGGPLMNAAAYKWKISFNENAKNVAWCNRYPEFNHNEFIGWSSHPVDKPYTVIDLRSSFDHPQVKKRFEVSAKLLSGKRPAPIVIEAEGKTELEQLLWTVVLGDFVSLYTALLNGLNPTPVDLIEKLKKEL
jgi:glucose/mannose-6-phosphate isomerase